MGVLILKRISQDGTSRRLARGIPEHSRVEARHPYSPPRNRIGDGHVTEESKANVRDFQVRGSSALGIL